MQSTYVSLRQVMIVILSRISFEKVENIDKSVYPDLYVTRYICMMLYKYKIRLYVLCMLIRSQRSVQSHDLKRLK